MKRAHVISGAAVVVVTLVLVWLIWTHLRTYLAADHQVVLAKDAQRRLFEMTIVLQDMENSAKGYVLTGEDRYKGFCTTAREDLSSRMSAVEERLPQLGLNEQFQSLRTVLDERVRIIGQVMELADSAPRERAATVLQSPAAVQNAFQIRSRVVELIGAVDQTLQDRLAVCRQSTLAMTRWVVIGIASLVAASTATVFLLWHDNVRQRRITKELAEARDLALAGTRARDEFLNVLSHELRTPITPALATVQMLERRTPPGTELHDDVQMIRRQIELEARIIEDLLNVEQTLRAKMVLRRQDVSLHTLLTQVVECCQQDMAEHALKFGCVMNATRDTVNGDESRLHLVLWHLLSNAVKFSPAGGSVSVRTDNVGAEIVTTITDTGIGLSEAQLRSIFEPFRQVDSSRTRRFGGLGVGLAISRHVAMLHGGTIRAASAGEGQGATFTLTIPLAKSDSVGPANTAGYDSPTAKTRA